MWLIVGLGNPGLEYERHRHNVGFMAVDYIASLYGFAPFRNKYKGLYSEGIIAGEKVFLLKPQTYMNNSGESVAELARFYKIPVSNIIAIHDDLDVLPAKVKVKIGGGAGGHNGLRSMDSCLGDKDYKRLRIGIGHPGDKDSVTGYVLGNFSKEDEKWVPDILNIVTKEIGLLLKSVAK